MQLIQEIISSLEQYPDIEFERKNENEIKILGEELNGFDIILIEGGRENMLYFRNFH